MQQQVIHRWFYMRQLKCCKWRWLMINTSFNVVRRSESGTQFEKRQTREMNKVIVTATNAAVSGVPKMVMRSARRMATQLLRWNIRAVHNKERIDMWLKREYKRSERRWKLERYEDYCRCSSTPNKPSCRPTHQRDVRPPTWN